MDNIPENLQSSEHYEKMGKNIDLLHDAIDDISEALDKLNSIE